MPQPPSSSEPPTPAEPAPVPALPPPPSPTKGTLARDAAIRELFRISGVPANERQLAGLRARRDELRDQLQHATDDRAELRGRLQQESDADAQRLLKQQLDHATGNVLSLDEAITTTERQIAAAPPELLAATQALPPTPDVRNLVPQDQAAGIACSTFGAGVVLTLLASRWRRVRRRGATTPVVGSDPQLQQLGVAVDAIALEVERIGEGQRFVTQLLAERSLAERSTGQPIPRPAHGAGGPADLTVEAPMRATAAPSSRVPTPH